MPSPGNGDDESPRSAEQSPPGPRLGDGPDADPDLDGAERTILQPPGHFPPPRPGDRFGADSSSDAGRSGPAPDPLWRGPGPGHVSWPPPYAGSTSPPVDPAADTGSRGPAQPPGPPIPSAPPRFGGGLAGRGGWSTGPADLPSARLAVAARPARGHRVGAATPARTTHATGPPGPPGGLAGPPGPLYYAPPVGSGPTLTPGKPGAPGAPGISGLPAPGGPDMPPRRRHLTGRTWPCRRSVTTQPR